jgi:hypothetical protein
MLETSLPKILIFRLDFTDDGMRKLSRAVEKG